MVIITIVLFYSCGGSYIICIFHLKNKKNLNNIQRNNLQFNKSFYFYLYFSAWICIKYFDKRNN